MLIKPKLRLLLILVALFLPPVSWSAEITKTNISTSITIPIRSVHDRIIVPAKVNGSKPLSFLLDTGYGITTIHPDLVESLGLTQAGRMTIIGIAAKEQATTYRDAVFDFGGVSYKPKRVASLPSDASTPSSRRAGILGAGFFRRFVVEIDSAKNLLRLHEPQSFNYKGNGEIIALQFDKDTPIIDATITTTQKTEVRGRFEVDTGCDDQLCLTPDFVATNHLLGAETSAGTKNGVGGSARIQRGTLPQLRLGRFAIEKPPVNFFMEGLPAENGLAGHIGMATLRNYKVIFDYSRKQMILEMY